MVIGLDVGGAATKAALFDRDGTAASGRAAVGAPGTTSAPGRASVPDATGAPGTVRTASRPFEVWRDLGALSAVVASVLDELDPGRVAAVALTMTAELSDGFATKREGVAFVLDAVRDASARPLQVYTTDGRFLTAEEARAQPRRVAASNWVATATLAARTTPDALIVDVGSTTADVIPVQDGRVAARGRSDLERLLNRELIYTGALRTNAAAISATVPVRGLDCPVASELFAVSADVHLLLGHVAEADCEHRLPDGRGASRAEARARLARLVCADGEELGADEVEAIARHLHERQVASIAAAMRVVARRFATPPPVVALGAGAFLAIDAARAAGLPLREPPPSWAGDAGRLAPAVALSILGAELR